MNLGGLRKKKTPDVRIVILSQEETEGRRKPKKERQLWGPGSSCVTLGKIFNLCEPQFLHM